MITVIIPTLNEERRLPRTLAALVPAMVDGVIKQVVVVDGGSADRTCAIADDAGADVFHAPMTGRGAQMVEGVRHAKASWLLFLHGDTVLETGWHESAEEFIRSVDRGARTPQAATFTFSFDDDAWQARAITVGVSLRTRVFKLPYGDQGLLISKALYQAIGGMQPLPLFEDVDIVRRLGRKRLHTLSARAITSADRYRHAGYVRRTVRNWQCLLSYYRGVPVDRIAARYNQSS